ncbi:hypothetical protein JCM10212_001603 [Sporobolomyces blumeae]
MSDVLPSPTKKPAMEPAQVTPADPSDIRGSMRRTAQTGYEHMISWRARESRAAVSRGHATPASSAAVNTRRPLGFSRTEPVLSFGANPPAASTSMFQPFQTANDINNLVFSDGRRDNELRPMWETGSNASESRTASRVGSGLFGSDAGGFGTETTTATDGDGDGFDLDDVLPPSSLNLGFAHSASSQGESKDSTRTVTQRLKRAYDNGTQASIARADGTAGGDDDEMAPTDVEDEEDDQVSSELPNMFGNVASGGRQIAGSRRAFGRTQSLPSQAFSGAMEF